MAPREALLGSAFGQILSAKGPDGVEGKGSGALGLWGPGALRLWGTGALRLPGSGALGLAGWLEECQFERLPGAKCREHKRH